MSRFLRLALVLLAGMAASWPRPQIVGPSAAAGDAIAPAVVEDYGHLHVLRLRGTPYEMGYQRGAAERSAIRGLVAEEIYRRRVLEGGDSHAVLLARAHQAADALPAEFRQELRGIADGAGLSYDDVLLLNGLSTPGLEALAFAAWPPFTHDTGSGGALLGYRLNAPGLAMRLRRHLLIAVYHPLDGQPYATLTWSGHVGAWCGLNQAGLALCVTPPETGDNDPIELELPPALLIRQLLARAQDGEQALRRALDRDYQAAFQLLIVDGRRDSAVAVEFGAHQSRIVEPQSGMLVLGWGQSAAVSLLSRNAGWLDSDKAMAVLASRDAPSGGEPGLCGASTLLNVLLSPGRDELWIGMDLWPSSCSRYLRVGPFE